MSTNIDSNIGDNIKNYINKITDFINTKPNISFLNISTNQITDFINNKIISSNNKIVKQENNLVDIEGIIIYFIISLFSLYYFLNRNKKLPLFIIKLFENKLFKLIIIVYILYVSNYNLQFAIFITFNFLLIIYLKNNQIVNDLFTESRCPKCRNNKCICMNNNKTFT